MPELVRVDALPRATNRARAVAILCGYIPYKRTKDCRREILYSRTCTRVQDHYIIFLKLAREDYVVSVGDWKVDRLAEGDLGDFE